MAKEYTEEEVREQLLKHVHSLISYWENEERRPEVRDKLSGLAFSILTMLDGCSIDLPRFIVAPDPHPRDKDYHKDNDENWYAENCESDVCCDISGCLHELFHEVGRKYGFEE
jgi:hypothetical protein